MTGSEDGWLDRCACGMFLCLFSERCDFSERWELMHACCDEKDERDERDENENSLFQRGRSIDFSQHN